MEEPIIIKGGDFHDERGSMRFVNDFSFDAVKRFYFIKHPDINIIRGWQGHQFEKKYFYPITGSFVVAWVKIDNFESPSDNLIPGHHILSATDNELISIPKGFANGLKALESNSEIMILSDMDLEQSKQERIRFPPNKWIDWSRF
ncbi:MAG: dTDP-4-dehydrorhamnose 3,5-epimerase-like enzyme [Desulforhopalus sp.]|jgi:dTDP-4-dehydrorhamnose 3,5-epimerase-like enzyme